MKKLLIFFVLLFFIVGCKDDSNINHRTENPLSSVSPMFSSWPVITVPDTFDRVEKLEILYPSYPNMRYLNLGSWQEYINSKYGLEILIDYKSDFTSILDGSALSGVLYLSHTDFVLSQMNSSVTKYSTDMFAYELSPYYKEYGWDRYMNTEYLEKLSINGRIYAIPAADPMYIVPRHYSEEYLSALQLSVPETVNELYEYLKAIKRLKKNDDNFYPMCIYNNQITPSTSDIFRAYGAFVNSQRNSTVSYNPNTGSFEDAVFSEDFKAALTFIKALQSEKLLFIAGYDQYVSNDKLINIADGDYYKLNKDFATEYWVIFNRSTNKFGHESWKNRIEYDCLDGYYLMGTNDRNVCEVRSDLSFYIFPKTIANIYGTVDLFNKIFTNSAYYADLKYGIEEVNYIILDKKTVPRDNLAGAYLNLKQINQMGDKQNSYYPGSIDALDTIPNKMWFEKNIFNDYHAYLADDKEDEAHFGYGDSTVVDSLFNKYLSTDDAIDEYIKNFLKAGRKTFIESLNLRLGSATYYDYP